MSTIKNPVLTGFNPDPVLFRDEDHYYLVVSTFEWLPGVRIYSSTNMVNWHYEASALTEPANVELKGNPTGGSIWGPYATYHNGTYYIVYTNVNQTRVPYKDVDNYIVTAKDIHGPWSKPVYINSSGFDPSIFFDDDGKAYFLNEIWDYRMETHNKSCGIVMQQIDPVSFDLIGEPKKLFDGTAPAKTEAPQIYKHGGYYCLFTAEGGTGINHQETIARSKTIWGPYEVDPDTPLITSKGHPELPLQQSGHASLIETAEHEWYIAHLCTRPLPGNKPILGRETAIEPVEWTDDGWIRLTSGSKFPALEVPAPKGGTPAEPVHHGFSDDLKHGIDPRYWNTYRQFADPSWCHADVNGLTIKAGQSPQSAFDQHLVATRQYDFGVTASVDMEYTPTTYLQLAGMTMYLDLSNYILLMATVDEDNQPVVVLQEEVAQEFKRVASVKTNGKGHYHFRIKIDDTKADFWVDDGDGEQHLGTLDVSFLSGGFTGDFIGMDAIDMHRRNHTQARFTNFTYHADH